MEMYATAAALAADRISLMAQVEDLRRTVDKLEEKVKLAEARTEAAVDEMLKLATLGRLAPVADEARQDQRKRNDIAGMDDILEEEDLEKVKEWEQGMEAGKDPLEGYGRNNEAV